jgi:hypothetical protein
MKNIFLFIIMALLFAFCKNDDPKVDLPAIPTCCGKVTAKLNGVDWEGIPTGGPSRFGKQGTYSIIVTKYENQQEAQELLIGNTPGETGIFYPNVENYNLIHDTTFFSTLFFVQGNDVVNADYDLMSNDSTNYVAIDSFEEATRYFKGRFNLTFVKNLAGVNLPDTIRMTDGVFEINKK